MGNICTVSSCWEFYRISAMMSLCDITNDVGDPHHIITNFCKQVDSYKSTQCKPKLSISTWLQWEYMLSNSVGVNVKDIPVKEREKICWFVGSIFSVKRVKVFQCYLALSDKLFFYKNGVQMSIM